MGLELDDLSNQNHSMILIRVKRLLNKKKEKVGQREAKEKKKILIALI